jgi:hypothetical protein
MFFQLFLLLAACCLATDVSECNCGYREDVTGLYFTESVIAYFNETGLNDADFFAQSYTHQAEKSWNALYRQGASPENVSCQMEQAKLLFNSL